MQYIVDTNVFIENLDFLNDKNIIILSHCLRELDVHKSHKNQNEELRFKARKAIRWIRENSDKVTYDLKDYKWNLNTDFDGNYVDNLIIQACVQNDYGVISSDQLVIEKAKAYNIPYEYVEGTTGSVSNVYTGFREIYLNTDDEVANFYQYPEKAGLLINEYAIIHYKEFGADNVDCRRWDGKSLVELVLPNPRVVEPQNYHQACALDLLNNMKVPIKIIAGTYGSGKTYLSVKVALDFMNNKNSNRSYGKIMVVRNPIGSGEQIGYLKGDKEDKTSDFFKPIIQHLNGGEQEAEILERQGKLLKEIPFYMKGLSIENTFILVDEAEDLNKKLIKLVGTRLGEKSCIVFSGDFNQAEDKYTHNNGLYIAIEKLKGNPLVGIVVLQDDVRSEASKVFAEL